MLSYGSKRNMDLVKRTTHAESEMRICVRTMVDSSCGLLVEMRYLFSALPDLETQQGMMESTLKGPVID